MLPFEFGIISFMTLTASFLVAIFGFIVFLGSKLPSSQAFVVITINVSLWILSMTLLAATPGTQPFLGDLIQRITYITGMFSSLSCFYFGLVFAKEKDPPLWIQLSTFLLAMVFIFFILFTNILFGGTDWIGKINMLEIQVWAMVPAIVPFLYDIIFILFCGSGLYFIYQKIKKLKKFSVQKKQQLWLMFTTLTVGFLPPIIFSMLLPTFGIHYLDWFGPVTQFMWLPILGISFLIVRQLNVKILFVEILVLVGVFLLFLSIFI